MGRILIVDDTLFMRTLLKNILSSGGHEIVGEAEDGDVGVNKYRELKPDLLMEGLQTVLAHGEFFAGALCLGVLHGLYRMGHWIHSQRREIR